MMHSAPENVLAAVTYFQERHLMRFLELTYQRYWKTGSLAGKLPLKSVTEEEAVELSALAKRPLVTGGAETISLAVVDQTLQETCFACGLLDVVLTAFPERPSVPRRVIQQQQKDRKEVFAASLAHLSCTFPSDTLGRWWIQHRLAWLSARYKRSVQQDPAQHQLILERIAQVAEALTSLPAAEGTHLAVFAQEYWGDPHALDHNREEGRLFLKALEDYLLVYQGIPLQEMKLPPREYYMRLYELVGLCLDTVSSTILLYGFFNPVDQNGTHDKWYAGGGKRIQTVPLCQVRIWSEVFCPPYPVYLVENPPVFESLVGRYLQFHEIFKHPLLVCTNGWPSLATMVFLRALCVANPSLSLWYSGDFDQKGLQIAAYIAAHFPGRLRFWRMDIGSYRKALKREGSVTPELQQLRWEGLPVELQSVARELARSQRCAYQEGIIGDLADDLLRDR